MKPITLARLREVLSYNSETGELHWRIARSRGMKPGDVAGTINRLGYRQIGIDRQNYFGHRLAWMLIHNCEYPDLHLDHINGVRSDNREDNLRLANYTQNRWNSGARNNKSGRTGVRWREHTKRWAAEIMEGGKTKHLGYFEDKEQASRAYNEAAKARRGEFARIE